MAQPDLVQLVHSDDIAALEAAWNEASTDPGDVGPFLDTLAALCEHDMPGRALALGSEMVEALANHGRTEDALAVGAAILSRGAHNDKLATRLFELIESTDGGQSWFEDIRSLAGLESGNLSAKALLDYEKYRRFTEGHVLYHRAGWGEGRVSEFRTDTKEVVIDFISGRPREMPLQAAIESLQPLPPDDLRSMRILAPERLQELAADQPSVLIRKAAVMFRGKITSTKVKETLCPSVIPTKKWNTFWKKAKAAAAHDPWLQIEGSSTRPVFVLRKKPVGLAEEAAREVQFADGLADSIRICRSYIAKCHDENAFNTILDVAEQTVETALAQVGTNAAPEPAHLLDGILLLAEHGRQTSVTPAEELRILLTEGDSFYPENFNKLENQQAREHAASLLPEAFGEGWAELCVDGLPRFPADVVEPVIQRLVDDGFGKLTLRLWDTVAPYPRRHPMMTYMLGCLYADGVYEGVEGAPDKVTVARVLMHLVRTLTADRKGDTSKGRLLTRLVSLMTGRRNLLVNVLEDIDRDDLAALFGISERGGQDFPQEIANLLLRTVAKKFPDLTAKPDKPFWESDYNFVTREGLARHREEYRVLVEEKIPANSKAIGVAASHGDISENSEWDAAMEEQRNLTNRAKQMDEELQLARLIEEQQLPESVAAPGTRVTFTDLTENEERSVRLLGPWDGVEADVLNYKAPLGQALLGMKPGQVTSLEMGGSVHELRIDEIEPL